MTLFLIIVAALIFAPAIERTIIRVLDWFW